MPKPAAVAPKETITHHFFVSGIGRRKLAVRCNQICGGAENVVKTETQQTFVNGFMVFITLGIYTPLEARVVLLTAVHRLPIIGQLYLRYRFLPVVLHSDRHLQG